jgi:heterotetrameric sarcosine oxidase gamma subunit
MTLKVSASMLEHQNPLNSSPDAPGGYLVEEPGLVVTASGAGFLLLQSRSESTLQDALTSEIGLRLPAPGEVSVRGDYALLWLTPAEWLLEAPPKEINSIQIALARRVASSLTVMTDMSDAFACCEVTGDRAAEVLMSGCSLDLRTDAFPLGRVARTALANIPVIIRRAGKLQRLRCLIDRSFAHHLLDWLVAVARDQRPSSAQ